MITDKDGYVLTIEGSVLRRWKKYFKKLRNEEGEKERVEELESV